MKGLVDFDLLLWSDSRSSVSHVVWLICALVECFVVTSNVGFVRRDFCRCCVKDCWL